MPSSTDRLRKKFMSKPEHGDGIDICENIIKSKGGKIVHPGWIVLPDDFNPKDDELLDAVEFLLHEWDYGIR